MPLPSTTSSPSFTTALWDRLLRSLATSLRLPPAAVLSPPADSGTAFQLTLPAAHGGVALPHPAILAMPCFLASFADTLPLLLADPVLHPYLSTPDSWPSSPSLLLRSASAAFLRITSLPTFAPAADSFTPIHQSVHSLLTTPTGSISIHLLPTISGRRSQHAFTHATFTHLRDSFLATSTLPATTLARIRAAAAPLAHSLFTIYYIPASASLTLLQTQFLYCHRLGIPLPFIPSPPPAICRPGCPTCPPDRPITASHDLFSTLLHALHHMSCGIGGFRHRRHDALVRLIAAAARDELRASTDTRSRLCSSSRSGRKTDCIITSY